MPSTSLCCQLRTMSCVPSSTADAGFSSVGASGLVSSCTVFERPENAEYKFGPVSVLAVDPAIALSR